jgi:hypothetical protein
VWPPAFRPSAPFASAPCQVRALSSSTRNGQVTTDEGRLREVLAVAKSYFENSLVSSFPRVRHSRNVGRLNGRPDLRSSLQNSTNSASGIYHCP